MISTVLWVTSGSKQGKSISLAYYVNDLFWTRKSFTVASVAFGDPERTAYVKAIELVCVYVCVFICPKCTVRIEVLSLAQAVNSALSERMRQVF